MINIKDLKSAGNTEWLKKIASISDSGWTMNPISSECAVNAKVCIVNPTEKHKMLIGYLDLDYVKRISDELDEKGLSIEERVALVAKSYSNYSKSINWNKDIELHETLLITALCYYFKTNSYKRSILELGDQDLGVMIVLYPDGKHNYIVRPVGMTTDAASSPTEMFDILDIVIKNDLSKKMIKKKNLKK
ncbi:hypothetical protein [Photobacterium kishitanii]|uniref:Uncharacterized protein n=1 Tax=Photobacterium kishitanii TaxID=318456 RepID=A0A2T3KM87_9GAMM|nr:hypothetical protein [Photobacterium kishitanii]PSV00901.1 hypothetical protein C9J27_02420 [Photobacterium kishitanii]